MNAALSMKVMWCAIEDLNSTCLAMEQEIDRLKAENTDLIGRLSDLNRLIMDDGK